LQAIENKVNILRIKNPLERSIIADWNAMEDLWEYCFDLLKCSNIDDCRCLLTEIVDNPRENRMKTCEFFFEKFGVAKFLLMNQSVLALYNTAKTYGIVVDCGHSGSLWFLFMRDMLCILTFIN